MSTKITLKDIAKKTGYTVNTVSHALKDMPDISDSTKVYISKTAKEMGYIRNASAGALRTGLTQNIGVITANVANPFFSIIIKEIEQCAFDYGYNILVFNTYGKSYLENQKIKHAISKSVDGIIISPVEYESESISYLQKLRLPFVVIGRSARDDSVSYVTVDDEKGGYIATKHLIDCGRRRIAYLSGLASMPSAPYRLAGYLRALEEAGIEKDDRLIHYLDLNFGSCHEAIRLLRQNDVAFNGVFAFNDMLAAEAFSTLYELNLRVPQDVGLVGFDNVQKDTQISIPTDSIGTTDASLGAQCVEILINQIKHPDLPSSHVTLDVCLYARGSAKLSTAR